VTQKYKFDGPKYSTQGVSSTIPLETQLIMWQLISELAKSTSSSVYVVG